MSFHFSSCYFRLFQVRSGEVRLVHVWSGKLRLCEVRSC